VRKGPALKWFTPSSRRCGRLVQSPLGATRVRLAGSQAAAVPIPPRCLKEPRTQNPRNAKTRHKGGPETSGRGPGELMDLTIQSFSQLRPVSQEPISCHGDARARA
jgi:hypothetical protein